MAWGGVAVAVVVTVVMVRRRTFGSVLAAAVVVAVVVNGAMYGRRGQGAATGWRLRVVVIDDDVGWVERALGGSNFVRKRLLRQVTAEQQRAGRAAEQGRTQQTCVGSRLASRISPEHVGDRHPFDQSNPIVFTESTFLSFIYVPFLLSFPHFEPCLPLHNCQVPHLDSLHLRPRRPLVERSHKVRDVRIRALRLAGDAVVRSVTDPAADGETVGDLVGEGTAGRLAHRCSAMRGRKTVVPEEDAWLG